MDSLLTLRQFGKMLANLSTVLEAGARCAETKKFEPEVLLNARLAPDQFNLIRQVQIACDAAKLCAARLAGKEAPKHADDEKTFAQLHARIAATADYLRGFSEADFKEASARRIGQPRWEGQTMSGEDYLHQHAVPNFYFHVTVAYEILRHNGVEIGKKTYLGELPLKK